MIYTWVRAEIIKWCMLILLYQLEHIWLKQWVYVKEWWVQDFNENWFKYEIYKVGYLGSLANGPFACSLPNQWLLRTCFISFRMRGHGAPISPNYLSRVPVTAWNIGPTMFSILSFNLLSSLVCTRKMKENTSIIVHWKGRDWETYVSKCECMLWVIHA